MTPIKTLTEAKKELFRQGTIIPKSEREVVTWEEIEVVREKGRQLVEKKKLSKRQI